MQKDLLFPQERKKLSDACLRAAEQCEQEQDQCSQEDYEVMGKSITASDIHRTDRRPASAVFILCH